MKRPSEISPIVFPYDHLILDACCVINLYASGKVDAILQTLGVSVFIADYVQQEEVLQVYSGPEYDVTQMQEPIELQPLIDKGLLSIASLHSESEGTMFVELATSLADGEAHTLAIALNRKWGVATDDRKAISLLERMNPALQVSTLALVKHWADTKHPSRAPVRMVLNRIRLRARYLPGSAHPFYLWWKECTEEKTE